MLSFPSPIAFWMGSWPVRWYGLSYSLGMVGAWAYCRFWVVRHFTALTQKALDDSVLWGMLGVVIGGRLGHVFLYSPQQYWENPAEILQVWKGGMAFHGGLLGVVLAFWLYSLRARISPFHLWDCWACGAPIGLFWGRVANFINQELYGRCTDVPWGVVFPQVDALPRHPSQLYEAGLEGILLGLVLAVCVGYTRLPKCPGGLSGVFLIGYGAARWASEYFREPLEIGTALGLPSLTLGQVYSLPWIIVGGVLVVCAWRKYSLHRLSLHRA